MKLNHIDLQVPDVHRATDFFQRYFGFELRSNPSSPAIAILHGDGDFVLVLQRKKRDDERWPEGFHIGFHVDALADVERVHALAKAEGLEVSDITSGNRGTLVYLTSADGILVEVNHRGKSGR